MNDVARLVLEAWEKLGPGIMRDPQELAKRLARRRMAILNRPPRAWCLALRASDRRINPAHWIITPEHAQDLNHPEHPYEPIEHEVTIQPHGLREFCRPVRTDWGALVPDIARQLGRTPAALYRARLAGIFNERRIKGLGGKWGHPIPLIHTWTALDPNGTWNFGRPDPLWGSLWEFLPDMIPDDFEQTILRRPHYKPFPIKGAPKEYWDRRFRGWRWVCPSCKKEVRFVFYPLPPQTLFDHLGYDPARIARISPSPPYSPSTPLAPVLGGEGQGEGAAPGSGSAGGSHTPARHPYARTQSKKFLPFDVHDLPTPLPTFACRQCHRIAGFTRIAHRGWNHLVTTLTRGLLYGHEVEKPSWYRQERKKTRTRQLNRTAPKREAVRERLLQGFTDRQIALDLMTHIEVIRQMRRHICKQERVANRLELAAKLGSPHPQPLNKFQRAHQRRQRIQDLLLLGLSYKQIAAREGIRRRMVHQDANAIYRNHALPPRAGLRALAEKLGLFPPAKPVTNQEVIARMLAGQSTREIAAAMRQTPGAIRSRFVRICRKQGVRGRKELFEKMSRTENSQVPLPT